MGNLSLISKGRSNMCTITQQEIFDAAVHAVIEASTSYSPDHLKDYQRALSLEENPTAKWILQMIIENATIAQRDRLPLCDDTGIPYVLIEVGADSRIEGNIAKVYDSINRGIAEGLRLLPGRPMAVNGDDYERISQCSGLSSDSGMVYPAPIRVKIIPGHNIKISVLMLGGGPEIRSLTFRIFHHHSLELFVKEIAARTSEMAVNLGCTPCIPAVGIGRTHYEATCLMMDAMTYGKFSEESAIEKKITDIVNESNTGSLGVGGSITALRSFVQVGHQRASGVRIVCIRPGCIVDPRRCTVVLG